MLSYLNRKSGQGLLLAVLVMLLVALMGAAFVGVISFNLAQSARHEDVVRADQMARAGIEYADQQMTDSTQGADWRPQDSLGGSSAASARAATSGYYDDIEAARGWSDGTYIKYPDPNNPTSGSLSNPDFSGGRFLLKAEYPGGPANSPTAGSIKITSVGRSTNNPAVFKLEVAYKPVTLANYLMFVTHKNPTQPTDTVVTVNPSKIAVLGTAPQIDLGADTMINSASDAATAGNTYIKVRNKGNFSDGQTIYVDVGANKRESKVIATGGIDNNADDQIDLTTALTYTHAANAPVSTSDLGANDTVNTILNGPLFINGGLNWYGNTTLNLTQTATRNDQAQIAGSIASDATNARSLSINVNGSAATVTGSGTPDAGSSATFAHVTNGAGGPTVYSDALGRVNNDRSLSDRWVTPIAPPVFVKGDVSSNNVQWVRFADLTKYSDNTLLTAGSAVMKGQTGFGTGIYISNYNYTTQTGDIQYASTTPASARMSKLTSDWTRTDRPPSSDPDSGWVNDLEYTPKGVEIVLRNDENVMNTSGSLVSLSGQTQHPYYHSPTDRHPTATLQFPGSAASHVSGTPVVWIRRNDGATIYDATGATLAAGTIQTFDYPGNGIILAEGNVRIRGNLPQSTSTRNFNLTVVSGGTIYVEGNILTPIDRGETLGAGNSNSHIALLAKDHLCINTTQFHHRGINGASPGPTAASTYPASTDGNDSKWIISDASNDDLSRNVTFSAVPSVTPKLTVRYGGVFKLNYRGANATATIQVSGTNPDLTGTAGTDTFGPQNLKSASSPKVHKLDDTAPDGLKNWVNTNNGWNAAQIASGFTNSNSKDLALLGNAIDVRYWYFWLPMTTKLDLTVGGTRVKDESGANITSDVFTDTFPKRYAIFTFPVVPSAGVETPVLFDRQTGSGDDFRLGRFKVEQVDASGNVLQQGTDLIVSALMYAQEGTFSIIPGGYFDDSTKTPSGSTDGAVRYRRYNYHIQVHGAVVQNYTADENNTSPYTPPSDVYGATFNSTKWTDKWSYPVYSGGSYSWYNIDYQYDPELRSATTTGVLALPKLPLAPGLMYVG